MESSGHRYLIVYLQRKNLTNEGWGLGIALTKKQTLQPAAAEEVRNSWMDDDRDEEAQLHKQTELLEQFESLYKVQLVNFQINPIKIGLWLHVIT